MNCAVHTDTPAAAYCRTCGKALCENCKRDVMGAIYCEPCIAARLQGTQPAAAAAVAPAAQAPSTPSPGVAMLLGFIPGVGAMYNGQFMKAFIHVSIFVLLTIASDNVSGYFGILVGFFVVYMAFDAYKTAEAKRMGLPLPDPLGLDRMFGLQEAQPSTPASAATASVTATGSAPSVSAASTQGHVQPSWARDQVPIGAIVLIALGVIFLLGNFTHIDLHRYWPLILVGLGVWIGYKRMSAVPRGRQ
jgi:LiaI-LiaF-like transmembrane region/B-box zinc finger